MCDMWPAPHAVTGLDSGRLQAAAFPAVSAGVHIGTRGAKAAQCGRDSLVSNFVSSCQDSDRKPGYADGSAASRGSRVLSVILDVHCLPAGTHTCCVCLSADLTMRSRSSSLRIALVLDLYLYCM
jgi:hypothetical protein